MAESKRKLVVEIATVVIAGLSLLLSIGAFAISNRSQEVAAAADERAKAAEHEEFARQVVFRVQTSPGPRLDGSKPTVETTSIVANFGRFPIEDVSLEASPADSLAEAIGEPPRRLFVDTFDIGTLGPCQAAFLPDEDAEYVLFTDINGTEWRRGPSMPPEDVAVAGILNADVPRLPRIYLGDRAFELRDLEACG